MSTSAETARRTGRLATGRRHGLRRGWAACVSTVVAASLALALPAQAQVRLPALGESASDDLSISAERQLGLEIMREARRDPALLDDPVLLAYVQSLWKPLVAAARQRGDITADSDQVFAWELFLVLDRSVNAFALPGGYVGVHLGLINITQTPDQLASVLAHELAHVTQRHIARSISVQQTSSLLSIATILLGVLAASRSNNADMANAAIMGGQGMAVQGQLNFSRDMEREADRIGFGLLGSAGFATAGMSGMFERMDNATRLSDNNAFPYLRSHPLTIERISEARSRILVTGSQPSGPPLIHALMRARARTLMDTSAQGLQRLSGESSSPDLPDQLGALYAGALSAALSGDATRGDKLVNEALALARSAPVPEADAEMALKLLQVQVRLAAKDAAGALKLLDALPPSNTALGPRPALKLRAQAALDLHRQQPAQAAGALRYSIEALQIWLADHPQDAFAWELLSSTTEAAGLKLRSLRAAAEARAMVGDLNGAIDRMRAAQAHGRGATEQDFIEGSVIDVRLRELMAERRERFAAERGGRGGPDGPDGPDGPVPQ
jgi:beta-barrel assembly-enhancing protease